MDEHRMRALLRSLDRSMRPDEPAIARVLRPRDRSSSRLWRTLSVATAGVAVLTVALFWSPVPPAGLDDDGLALLDLPESALTAWELSRDTCDPDDTLLEVCLLEDASLASAHRR